MRWTCGGGSAGRALPERPERPIAPPPRGAARCVPRETCECPRGERVTTDTAARSRAVPLRALAPMAVATALPIVHFSRKGWL